jgi:hypothetical protein
VVYKHNGILFGPKGECMFLVAGKWMKLEIIMLNEISQSLKTNIWCSLICGIFGLVKYMKVKGTIMDVMNLEVERGKSNN